MVGAPRSDGWLGQRRGCHDQTQLRLRRMLMFDEPVAAGTPVTRQPPHGSLSAELPRGAPASGSKKPNRSDCLKAAPASLRRFTEHPIWKNASDRVTRVG